MALPPGPPGVPVPPEIVMPVAPLLPTILIVSASAAVLMQSPSSKLDASAVRHEEALKDEPILKLIAIEVIGREVIKPVT